MAKNSGQFQPGNKLGGRPKGLPNKITLDQRAIFDEAISSEVRVQLVKKVVERALNDPDDGVQYMKLAFEYIFSKPRIGHDVSVLNLDEVLSTDVCDAAWREIIKEARERDAQSERPILIDAKVIDTPKGNGRQKTNGQARNGRKKKANGRKKKNGKARNG